MNKNVYYGIVKWGLEAHLTHHRPVWRQSGMHNAAKNKTVNQSKVDHPRRYVLSYTFMTLTR